MARRKKIDLTDEQIERELLKRRRAQANLVDYARYTKRGYRPGEHHHLICSKLEAVERGEVKRLMINMPPRHGKSETASLRFPAWVLGRRPEWSFIGAAYNGDKAGDYGRDVRNIVQGSAHQALFPGSGLAEDSQASMRWHTLQGGGYTAAGVGTALTGRGGHILLIDDPVKDREEADSQRLRDRAYNWYMSTAYTRLEAEIAELDEDPLWNEVEEAVEDGQRFDGAICIIQCMTGDTPVLMADGAEMLLADLRIGDEIATFDDCRISTAKIMNWANQGPDLVYEIRMKSGKIVRANARHPFLVKQGEKLVWKRLKNIVPSDQIVRVNGGNGRVKPANGTGATSRSDAGDTATPITTSGAGGLGIDRRRSIQSLEEKRIFATGMALASQIMSGCCPSRTGSARSAKLSRTTSRSIGTKNSASTTATAPERSGRSSATTVTTSSEKSIRPLVLNKPLSTSDFTTDEVVEIVFAGCEDVYDIQVERTENFIANGLVSHNTRWHDDDLSGRLLRDMEKGADQWDVLSLPAIREEEGKVYALWPQKYPLEKLEATRKALTAREWRSLYQQEPSPEDGDYFKRDWFKWHDPVKTLAEARKEFGPMSVVITSDFAVSDAQSADFTSLGVWGLQKDKPARLLKRWRGQTNAAVWIEEIVNLIREWDASVFFGESGVIRRAIEPILRRRMKEEQVFCRLEWLTRTADKVASARPFQGRAEMGLVSLPKDVSGEEIMAEMLKFPTGAHDDDVDMCALLGMALAKAHPAVIYASEAKPEIKPDDYGVDEEESNVIAWKVA